MKASYLCLKILDCVHSQEGLSPCHLKKAKLMFFYARYPSSNTLKTYFPDVKVPHVNPVNTVPSTTDTHCLNIYLLMDDRYTGITLPVCWSYINLRIHCSILSLQYCITFRIITAEQCDEGMYDNFTDLPR